MIQRIQSLYLVFVLLLCVALFIVPVYYIEFPNTLNGMAPHGLETFNLSSNKIYLLLNSAVGLLTMGVILLFKYRNLQIRLCNLVMLIICLFIVAIFFFSDHTKSNPGSMVHYAVGCYLPLVQLVLCFLAMRAIRKDEELVRSTDRLR